MSKNKKKHQKYLKWFVNRLKKIEKQKRRKKRHSHNNPMKFGIKYSNNAIKIIFPETIDLYNRKRCEETLDFFNREFSDTSNYENGVIFNFSLVKKITLSGGIIIRCLYDYLKSKHAKVRITNVNKDKIKQILFHIGVFKDEKLVVEHKDISRWNIHKWNRKKTPKKNIQLEIISEVIENTTGWGEQSASHKRLYEVIPELLYNCIQHAYDDSDSFQMFYLFSGIADNKYVFCVLDRGMGFKTTYNKRTKGLLPFEDIENIENDGDYIKYSIQMGHSSLKIPGRGNGLATLKENILRLGGELFIHSYQGKVQVSSKKGDVQSENRYPLVGSLLQFEIPIIWNTA